MRHIVYIILIISLSGCAGMGANYDQPRDPYEKFNRSMYSFNQKLDSTIFNPISNFYKAITPEFVDRGLSNFFSNLNEIVVIVNDLLQFKITQAFSDIARFVVNSTVGLFGFMDVSTSLGLKKHREDFGQTLAKWGFGSGPYLVLPIFGPSTVRDAAGLGIDTLAVTPVTYIDTTAYRASVLALNFVDFKADLLSAERLLSEAALDEYEFTKSAYFNLRNNLINDRDMSSDGLDEELETIIVPESP